MGGAWSDPGAGGLIERDRELGQLEDGLRAAAEGRFRVLIDQVLPLSQAVLAHELTEAREGLGKILLDPTRLN